MYTAYANRYAYIYICMYKNVQYISLIHPCVCVSRIAEFHTAYLYFECKRIFTRNIPLCLHLSLLPFQICRHQGATSVSSLKWMKVFFTSAHHMKHPWHYPTSEMPQGQRVVVYTIMDLRILKLLAFTI